MIDHDLDRRAAPGEHDAIAMPGDADVFERVLAHARGTLLVTGEPGSGKTRLLEERFARLVEAGADPERILLLTVNRRARRAARLRVLRRIGRTMPGLAIHTPASWALDVVGRRFTELGYTEPPQLLSAPEQLGVVREMLANESGEQWPACAALLRVRGFVRQVAEFVLRAQEMLLEPGEVAALAARHARAEAAEAAEFYDRYLDVNHAASRVDAGGLLSQAARLLQDGLTDLDRFEHVLVDDLQDAGPALEHLVSAIAPAAATVVVASDPGGGVLGRRGVLAPPEIHADDLVALPPGDRAPVAGLDDLDAEPVSGAGGMIEARLYAHPAEEAEAAALEILRLRATEGTPWEQIGVVVRRDGEHLTALRHALSRHGVPFVVAGGGSTLTAEPANAPLLEILRYVAYPDRRSAMLEHVLTGPIGGLTPPDVRALRRDARKEGTTVEDAVAAHARLGAFRDLVAALEPLVATGRPDEAFWTLWRMLPYRRELVASRRHRDLDAIVALSEVVARFAERRPGVPIVELLESLETAEFAPDPASDPAERYPHAVRVLTARHAHGQRIDHVIVAGCVEGEFPATSARSRLVSIDDLVAPRTPAELRRERLGMERRLFRLVVTRATRRTLLLASESASATKPRTPSRYAARLGVEWVRGERPQDATSPRALVAALRRRVRAGDADALATLRAAGHDTGSWWYIRDWTDPAEPLYPDEVRTSYSRLSSLDNCPLQYLYQVEMGLDPTQSHAMWLGSIVHDIIDRAQRGEIARELGAVLAALDEAWDPGIFPNRALEHRRFIDAQAMLRRWIEHEKAEVVHSEYDFSYPIDGAVIRGKIDAVLRMENGNLRVVDYKTGRSAPTTDEIKDNLQLAAYFLAMRRVDELSALGKPGYLQLAFIGIGMREGFKNPGFAPPRDFEQIAEARIASLVSMIRAEKFAPSPDADCRWCSFKTICPMWAEGEDAAKP